MKRNVSSRLGAIGRIRCESKQLLIGLGPTYRYGRIVTKKLGVIIN